jgi:hypothetical protein
MGRTGAARGVQISGLNRGEEREVSLGARLSKTCKKHAKNPCEIFHDAAISPRFRLNVGFFEPKGTELPFAIF